LVALLHQQCQSNDAVVTFQECCTRWAERYANGEISLQRVADLLEAMAPPGLSVDEAQGMTADATTLATGPNGAGDEYQGLSSTFARACKLADEQEAARTQNHASGGRLGTRQHVAQSTLDAAEYLIKENDPAHFERWLLEHPARERAAIVAHIRAKP
jgi:hypothetical protein